MCHCFARSGAAGMVQHRLPYVKQWHTSVRDTAYGLCFLRPEKRDSQAADVLYPSGKKTRNPSA